MQKWEYHLETFRIGEKEAQTKLNSLGREGWELVTSVEVQRFGGDTYSGILLFKRPI